jgi:hypothetical protein
MQDDCQLGTRDIDSVRALGGIHALCLYIGLRYQLGQQASKSLGACFGMSLD